MGKSVVDLLDNPSWVKQNTVFVKRRSIDLWENVQRESADNLQEGRKLTIEYNPGGGNPLIYFYGTRQKLFPQTTKLDTWNIPSLEYDVAFIKSTREKTTNKGTFIAGAEIWIVKLKPNSRADLPKAFNSSKHLYYAKSNRGCFSMLLFVTLFLLTLIVIWLQAST